MQDERHLHRAAHRLDSAIAAALQGARAMPGSGNPVLVAFRNEAGELYRYTVLDGPAQLRYLRQRLFQLRLLADRDDAGGMLAVLGALDVGARAERRAGVR